MGLFNIASGANSPVIRSWLVYVIEVESPLAHRCSRDDITLVTRLILQGENSIYLTYSSYDRQATLCTRLLSGSSWLTAHIQSTVNACYLHPNAQSFCHPVRQGGIL